MEIVLPSKFKNKSIKEWHEYNDSNIFILIRDIDGEITTCKTAWINSKFKAYYFKHHMAPLQTIKIISKR